ncbi:hypothetical protein BIV23_16090 [Streptomyces monashensis]|uniref:Uncharacterized protein n=1 Tax=Streptomyces monashensis TaxID=1678012 RepID=A0A1S2QG30_9ACTN|nr:hypothetical protein BIV23_16090 [Streptomyces monashensis]
MSPADKPVLSARLLWDTEPGYDHAVIEAHTAGADDWTTPAEAGSATTTAATAYSGQGFLIGGHPWLTRHLTLAASFAAPPRTSETSLGAWRAAGPPAGSPAVRKDRTRTGALFRTYAAVTTDDTVLLGFGLEQVPSAAGRAALLGNAFAALGA